MVLYTCYTDGPFDRRAEKLSGYAARAVVIFCAAARAVLGTGVSLQPRIETEHGRPICCVQLGMHSMKMCNSQNFAQD